ncbi:MAG TPA: hypothetical protein PLM75_03435 [bacterium]|nr:hypothetical protein [bacterium]HPP86898.1 hypothetical protein [bacterium]
MKVIPIVELFNQSNKNKDDSGIFEKTVIIDFSDTTAKIVRDKGVDTIMFEAENGATIVLQKDCKTEKIIGIEIFQ